MKASVLAACAALLMSSSAIAQTTTTTPSTPPAATQPPASSPPARTEMKTQAPTEEVKGAWNVRDFMRSRVYNMNGERIGDVNDILINDSGQITAIVIGVGGFLGIGEKEVSMTTDQVKRMIHSDGQAYFTVNATKDQLMAAPDYVRPAKAARQTSPPASGGTGQTR
ncbi:MAG TPA: PRC-barrel domain-containing protein [Hyphomicrobiaceae bacterium]|nr:PRC-barrel domain-containing protein [Hyphomicrobiaceae bacterium]